MHRIQNKEMIFICFTQNGALKLEKTIILCYTIFGSIRIEILKHQEQGKEAEQKPTNNKNQKLSTGGNRL